MIVYIEIPVTAKAVPKQKSLREIRNWCEDNLEGNYRHHKKEMSCSKLSPVWIFEFENEDDLIAFKLRWL